MRKIFVVIGMILILGVFFLSPRVVALSYESTPEASQLKFEIKIIGLNATPYVEDYDNGIVNLPILLKQFNDFNAEISSLSVSTNSLDFSMDSGEYVFDVQLLDYSNNIIQQIKSGADFYILSDPVVDINQTYIYANFPYNPSARNIRVIYNNQSIFEQEFISLICNYNEECENSASGNEGMFENYLSCPGDCDYFAKDGICNTAPGKPYAFNDGYCDEDCLHDIDREDNESGECYKENCNGKCGEENCLSCEVSECKPISNGVSFNFVDFNNYCSDENTAMQYSCKTNLLDTILSWFGFDFNQVSVVEDVTCSNGQICSNGECIVNPLIDYTIREIPPAPPVPPGK